MKAKPSVTSYSKLDNYLLYIFKIQGSYKSIISQFELFVILLNLNIICKQKIHKKFPSAKLCMNCFHYFKTRFAVLDIMTTDHKCIIILRIYK